MRFGAVTVRAQVGHDHAIALRYELRRVAITHPVHYGGGKVAVDQYQRSAVAQFAISEPGTITAFEKVNSRISCHGIRLWRNRAHGNAQAPECRVICSTYLQ
ncbi:hypothetical protein DYGSA30_35470 [Dyella sp. GSA-30]|nr:hypothetical protein DYGSA30_35470 [Dyella sp. GSA-30]